MNSEAWSRSQGIHRNSGARARLFRPTNASRRCECKQSCTGKFGGHVRNYKSAPSWPSNNCNYYKNDIYIYYNIVIIETTKLIDVFETSNN